MANKTYTLDPGQKATQIMTGTADLLIWGDLITREHVRISTYLNTLAEDYIPFLDSKVLFLAPVQQVSPIARNRVYVKREEVLFFYAMAESEPPPEESETRRLEPIELWVGAWHIQGSILKSPIADMHTMLLVAKEAYTPIWQATVRHTAKPWLGSFSTSLVQVRMDRMIVAI